MRHDAVNVAAAADDNNMSNSLTLQVSSRVRYVERDLRCRSAESVNYRTITWSAD